MTPPSEEIKPTASLYRFGEFELDPIEETLRRDGTKSNINRRMFQVLRLLIERNGEIIGKNEFFEKVWGGSFVEDNNLTVTIAALRRVLGDDAKQARFIENIPRKGYRFVARVERVTQTAAVDKEGRSSTTQNQAPRSLVSFRASIVALALVCIALLAIVVVGRKTIWQSNIPAVKRIGSVAVLPFKTEKAEDEYLADGITDGIINNLSRETSLRVIDRNSTYINKGKEVDPASLGRDLSIGSIVSGQIEQNDGVYIINATLTDVATNTPIWRQQFRRRASDIYGTQIEIARAIVQTLKPDEPGKDVENRGSRDPIAYDAYLKGRFYWNKRTSADFERSAGFFKTAIDRDPTFAEAYVGLAEAYTLGASEQLSVEEKNALIRGTIQKALEIDDSLGEAYATLAINKCYYDWDFSGAERDYKRAIELKPNDATAHHWYAEFLTMQGRFDESFAEYDRALSLDPLSLPIRADRAFAYYYLNDFDKAIEYLNKITASNPEYVRAHEFLKYTYRDKGMFEESNREAEKILALLSQSGQVAMPAFERARKNLSELKDAAKTGGSDGYWSTALKVGIEPTSHHSAVAYAHLGDREKAFEFLEKAFKERYSGMVWLKVTPEFDWLRTDPRFQDLLRRVGFTE